MILDFSITNFKSINEMQTISFEATNDSHLEKFFVIKKDKYRILKLATILGANASGKSNVLKAFNLLRKLILEPCENKTETIGTDCFALNSACKERETEFKLNFICKDSKFCYEVKFNDSTISNESLFSHPFGELRQHEVFVRTTDPTTKVATLKLGAKYRSAKNTQALKVNLLHNRTVFGSFLNSNIDIPWLSELMDWAKNFLMPIVTTNDQNLTRYVSRLIYEDKIKKEVVAELLQKADIGVCDIKLEKKEETLPVELVNHIINDSNAPDELKQQLRESPVSVDYTVSMFHSGEGHQIPFEFEKESSGTQRYFELLGILLQLVNRSRFVAIDELENKLHPDLYMHFVMTYLNNANESQLLFTTHMREFLEDKDTFRDDSVWFTEKLKSGATELYSLADFGSDVLRSSTNRSHAYRSGRLGAIPNTFAVHIVNQKDETIDE